MVVVGNGIGSSSGSCSARHVAYRFSGSKMSHAEQSGLPVRRGHLCCHVVHNYETILYFPARLLWCSCL